MHADIISLWNKEAAGGILAALSAGSAPQHGDVERKQPSSSASSILGLEQNPLPLPTDACAIKCPGTWNATFLSGVKKNSTMSLGHLQAL